MSGENPEVLPLKNVLVVGASGFIGKAVLSRLLTQKETKVKGSVRNSLPDFPKGAEQVVVGDLGLDTDWTGALKDIDVVIHSAARVHVMRDVSVDPLREYRRVNVEGTLNLAKQAADAGVKRFIFISSIKVNGETTSSGHPFTANDKPNPNDPYGVSKYEAEIGLQKISEKTGMEIVIIRPPLVYGPGVKANFLTMMKWLSKSIPLPLGAIHNKRSFVAMENLVDLIAQVVDHPAAANQTFLASDDEDLSTTDLLKRLAYHLGRPARLIPIPQRMLEMTATLLGKKELSQRLCSSLQIDISKTKQLLNWSPPLSVDQGLEKTVKHFLENLNP